VAGCATSLLGGQPDVLLAADERMIEGGLPATTCRWYRADGSAVVLGLAQQRRAERVLDRVRCAERGVAIVPRRAGGGLVLLDADMLCLTLAVPLPHPKVGEDLTASYRWLGDAFTDGLQRLGLLGARRVEVGAARRALHELRAEARRANPVAELLLETCYASPSPHEVLVGERKLVGFAQVRRRDRALFQVGLLLRDQSPLADLVRVPDDAVRAAYRAELRRRTVGLADLLPEFQTQQLIECLAPAIAHGLDLA
jgi:lipoate-protein ligase A